MSGVQAMRKILVGACAVTITALVVGSSGARIPGDTPHDPVFLTNQPSFAGVGPPQRTEASVSRKLVLPNVRTLTTRLLRSSRETAVRQLASSRQVVAFFQNPSRTWLRALRHEKCWEVPWQRSCTVARHAYRLHLTLAVAAQRKLDREDPTIRRLDAGLRGTPMEGLGKTLRDIGRRYNVSPFFMAAAAGTESSFGFAGCGGNPKNVWGLAACDGRWSVPYFETWDEAITFYAKFLSDRWPSASSPFHYFGYAACDACWGRKTASWMQSRFGEEAYTKYR